MQPDEEGRLCLQAKDKNLDKRDEKFKELDSTFFSLFLETFFPVKCLAGEWYYQLERQNCEFKACPNLWRRLLRSKRK